MYFDSNKEVIISDLFNKQYSFYAHKMEGIKEKETLDNHINLVKKYFYKIVNKKKLDKSFEKIEKEFFVNFKEDATNLFREMILNTVILHDIGKINPLFQDKKMDNNIIKNISEKNKYTFMGSKHSLLSAVLYLDYYGEKINTYKNLLDKEEIRTLRYFAVLNSYIISRHHGSLLEFAKYMNDINDECSHFTNICDFLEEEKNVYARDFKLSKKRRSVFYKSSKNFINMLDMKDSIYIYTYEKLLFSILVACDYYATSEYMNDSEIEDFGEINSIEKFYGVYERSPILKSIRKYEKEKYNPKSSLEHIEDINILRNELFLESENNLKQNFSEDIFYLEAPTGSGKSNMAMNLSFKLIEEIQNLNKINYIYPFNTLIEQNIKTIKKIFNDDENIMNDIAVVNSVTPIKVYEEENEDEDINYKKSLLNRQFLNYPMILSTHVTLFDTMFGNTRQSAFAFHQLANSVIVLDEIQCYRNIIWTEIITFLKYFCQILNIKVIIMSATLPNLNNLLEGNIKSINLIENRERYFKNHLFKDRVTSEYDLLNEKASIDDIYNHVVENSHKNKKIVLEFINKKSAYSFYNRLKDDDKIDTVVELMTGDDNLVERERIIDRILSEEVNKKGIILVATQVVEAGIDIDMDIGYKDISILDSEEQFMGRINRSCLKRGELYFFDLDKSNRIYQEDIRSNKEFTLEVEDNRNILKEKNYDEYYCKILREIKKNNKQLNDNNVNEFFIKDVAYLNSATIKERMKLIKDDLWSVSVYFCRRITLRNNNIVDGKEVWEEYKDLLKDNNMDYAQKQIRLSKIKSKMNYFIYKVNKNSGYIYDDQIGEIYCIDNGEEYFENGKLNREKFENHIGEFI